MQRKIYQNINSSWVCVYVRACCGLYVKVKRLCVKIALRLLLTVRWHFYPSKVIFVFILVWHISRHVEASTKWNLNGFHRNSYRMRFISALYFRIPNEFLEFVGKKFIYALKANTTKWTKQLRFELIEFIQRWIGMCKNISKQFS